jgi:hypothetical protein
MFKGMQYTEACPQCGYVSWDPKTLIQHLIDKHPYIGHKWILQHIVDPKDITTQYWIAQAEMNHDVQ